MKEIEEHMTWLLRNGFINCVQCAEAIDRIALLEVERSTQNVGHNPRPEFDG